MEWYVFTSVSIQLKGSILTDTRPALDSDIN